MNDSEAVGYLLNSHLKVMAQQGLGLDDGVAVRCYYIVCSFTPTDKPTMSFSGMLQFWNLARI